MRKMEDSGVEFIGAIPTDWEIIKVKYLGEYRNGLTYTPNDLCNKDEGILVLRSSNIKDGKLAFDDNVYVSCPVKEDLKVRDGDILICSRNGSRDLVGLTLKPCKYLNSTNEKRQNIVKFKGLCFPRSPIGVRQ